MRRKLSVAAIVFTLLLSAQLLVPYNSDLQAADYNGAAQIFVENPVFDFGTVAEGEVVSHVYEIRNKGAEPLLITSHHAVCGCTSAVLDESEVAPGQHTRFEVRFDTRGFSGRESKIVRVNSNDPKTPSLALSLQGQVDRELAVSPARVYFGKVEQGKSATQQITVSSTAAKVLITDVASNSKYLKVARDEKKGAAGFLVTLLENAPVGILRENIVVTTTSKHHPAITVPVFARVLSDFELFPSEISFGLIDQEAQDNKALEQTVLLKSSHPINILEVKSNGDFVVVEAVDSTDSLEKILKVTLKQGAKGVIKEKVTIKTDNSNKGQNEIVLPVYGIVAKRDV